MNYYNENDPYAAQWLRNLIDAGLIPAGDVDDRSITEVQPNDLSGYQQCHFFAGIGGWCEALRLAGWPVDVPVWTGSCPCQPFSNAGKRQGTADERHVWPEFRRLIAECSPTVVFGEQVASKDGRAWLAGVRADLEALGYAVGAADLCAASVGAPHIRQRLWWVADADMSGQDGRPSGGQQQICDQVHGDRQRLEHAASNGRDKGRAESNGRIAAARCGLSDRLGNSTGTRRQEREVLSGGCSQAAVASPWQVFERAGGRRIEPGLDPLAHGIPRRMDKLRGYGNAIVPQCAAKFIEAFMDTQIEALEICEAIHDPTNRLPGRVLHDAG